MVYHENRSAIDLGEDWKLFLRTSYNPIFCQGVGHFIFKDLVKAQLAVHSSNSTLGNVTYEYSAIYSWICSTGSQKKLLRSSLHNKKDLDLCLDDLISDGEETPNHTSNWLASINCWAYHSQ